ncbi:MAG: hypothetical protein IKS17_09235 [Firmicutes bacterium]|nr:hypothetical protein [Bacillota bacterium]
MKLSDGKKAALKRNRDNTKERTKRRVRMSAGDRTIVAVLVAAGVVMSVFIAVKAMTRRDVSQDVPDNYYKVMANYVNETDDVDANPNQTEGMPHSMINEPTPVSCWGDSFTLTADASATSYAGVLASELNCTVYNIASDNDTLMAVAGREGGIPIMVTPFIIPEDKTPSEITLNNVNGEKMQLDMSKNAGLNPCTIGGVEGMISKMNDKLYFTRSTSGERTMIMEPAVVYTRGMNLRLSDITVFFVGSDELFADPEATVSVYRAMADNLDEGNDKYIVMGPVRGDLAQLKAVEEALSAEFGDKFLNLRQTLCDDAQKPHDNFTLSAQDIKDAQSGIVPEAYFASENYFNDIGTYATGSAAAEYMRSLGYFEDENTEQTTVK